MSRQSGFEVNPITVQDAAAYFKMAGYVDDIAIRLLKLIQRMDGYYLKFLRDKRETTRRAEEGKRKGHNANARNRNRR